MDEDGSGVRGEKWEEEDEGGIRKKKEEIVRFLWIITYMIER